jgi:hypothetical protein
MNPAAVRTGQDLAAGLDVAARKNTYILRV